MYIILIAWGFVVTLMAAAEALSTTVAAGMLTFIFYGLLPMAILRYLLQTPERRKRRARQEAAQAEELARKRQAEVGVRDIERATPMDASTEGSTSVKDSRDQQ